MSDGVTVSGGVGGIRAESGEIASLGRHFGSAATDLLGSTLALHGYLVHPALAASALLDPVGFAQFEAQLTGALDGPRGLTWAATRCGALDGELRFAAAAYVAADTLGTHYRDELSGIVRFPSAVIAAQVTLAATGSLGAAGQELLIEDPGIVDLVSDGAGVPSTDGVIAPVIPDGHGVVRSLGTDRGGPAGRPPRDIDDVLGDLERRSADPHDGSVDVRFVELPDGGRRVIVDITGTKSWSQGRTSDVTSLTTDERGLAGDPGAYEQGVLAAMRRAGVRPDDDVMMVGHSEGGMVAVTAARDAIEHGEFHVTHVVTAGSPIGRTVGELPGNVQVLALENAHDVVPHADGIANPDLPNVTTVTGSVDQGTVAGNHHIGTAYRPIAREAQESDSRSVRHFLRSARGYFGGRTVRTHSYQIVRRY